jgi:hypothetical protein
VVGVGLDYVDGASFRVARRHSSWSAPKPRRQLISQLARAGVKVSIRPAVALLTLDHSANFGAKGVQGEGFRQHVHARLEKLTSKCCVLGVSGYEKYF